MKNYTKILNTHSPELDPVLIVGGGPVGLFLANLLGAAGRPCTLIEKETDRPDGSMAIGITPPSMKIFKRIGVAEQMIKSGVKAQQAYVHDRRRVLGGLSFKPLTDPYPFILSLQQSVTERILQENLSRYPSVTILKGHQLLSFQQVKGSVESLVLDRETQQKITLQSGFIIGCDGRASLLRKLMGVPYACKHYGLSFLMGDFPDNTEWGNEAHLFFTPKGSVESFPLSEGYRRWIVQSCADSQTVLKDRVSDLCGHHLDGLNSRFETAFSVQRLLCKSYVKGNAILCGDAAHLMSPVGGQGMNTGFADAEHLSEVLVSIYENKSEAKPVLLTYSKKRSKAFRTAANRAAAGMWMGTRTGSFHSYIRSVFLTVLLNKSPLKRFMPAYFAMLTIPKTIPKTIPETTEEKRNDSYCQSKIGRRRTQFARP
jgi:2-polyprenyl-6-methoxyphenol hydroxylase-like FAD-dependent oxidoreductase